MHTFQTHCSTIIITKTICNNLAIVKHLLLYSCSSSTSQFHLFAFCACPTHLTLSIFPPTSRCIFPLSVLVSPFVQFLGGLIQGIESMQNRCSSLVESGTFNWTCKRPELSSPTQSMCEFRCYLVTGVFYGCLRASLSI